jgi:hypothetical protein
MVVWIVMRMDKDTQMFDEVDSVWTSQRLAFNRADKIGGELLEKEVDKE